MAIPLTLKVYKGDALVATKEYERDIIKIGRLASAHLCVEDEKVSRIHSVIDATDGKLSITDMGSMEGTYVNGKRVNKSALSFGDEIRVGNTRITVESRAGAGVPAGRATEATDQSGAQGDFSHALPTQVITTPLAQQAEPKTPPPARAAPPPPIEEPAEQVVMTPARTARPPSAPANVARPPSAPANVARPPSGGVARAPVRPARPRAEASGNLGLQVRFAWGDQILAVHQFDKPTDMVIGSTAKCSFSLGAEKLGAQEFQLLKAGQEFTVRVPSRAVGEIDDGQGPVQLKESNRLSSEDGAKTVALNPNDFLWADLGGVRAEFSFTPMPKKVFVPLADRLDYRFMNLLLLILFAVGAFVISAKNFSFDDEALDDDLLKRPAVVAKFLLKQEEKKKNPLLEQLKAEKKKNDGEAAAKAKGDEGKMGVKSMKENTHQRSGQKAIDPNAKDRAKAMVTSLFGGKNGGIQTIFGSGGLGGDLKSAVGNMFGNQVGNSGGLGGLGLKGTGMGGGGAGNTVGIGAIGTHGRGGGTGAYGNGVGGLGGKKDVDIGISNDTAVVMGSLDKELIRQVIHRNRQQIQYCYEMQLSRFPKLNGKVAISFVIGPEGTVLQSHVASNSTNNSELGSCISSRFHSWLFPKPKGGGIVQVTYPVVLKQSGQ